MFFSPGGSGGGYFFYTYICFVCLRRCCRCCLFRSKGGLCVLAGSFRRRCSFLLSTRFPLVTFHRDLAGVFVPVCCSFILIMDLVRGFPHSLVLLLPFTAARTPAFQVTRWKYFTFSLHKAAILVSVSLCRVCLLCFASVLLFCAEPILYAYATDSRLRGCGKEGRCGGLHSSSATPLVLAVSDNMQKQIYTSVLRVFVCDPL